jgi:hypothetical protein
MPDMIRKRLWVPVVLLALAAFNAAADTNRPFVIVISVDGMGSEYVKPLLAAGLANELTTFKRFQAEGAGTLNARDDANYAVTLPNHVTMMTGRRVSGAAGHNWSSNTDPAPTDTLALNKGSYVASGFDVAHDNGLRTGIWSGKSKFSLFQQSYSSVSGAADVTGADNGRDKIDYDKVVAGISAAALTSDFTNRMTLNPFNFVFFHYQDPDATGHASGWSSNTTSAFAATLKLVDTQIGKILQFAESHPGLRGRTTVILTADHGGHGTTHGDTTNPLDYTIPFYAWGAGVEPGADLYALNPGARTAPGAAVNPSYSGGQPVRNGDAANLALDLLGLGAVPGSMIDSAQDLFVSVPNLEFTGIAPSGGGSSFTFTGTTEAPGNLVTERAASLAPPVVWVPIQTNAAPAGPFSISVPWGTNTCAFFRLMLR